MDVLVLPVRWRIRRFDDGYVARMVFLKCWDGEAHWRRVARSDGIEELKSDFSKGINVGANVRMYGLRSEKKTKIMHIPKQ